MNNEFCNNNAHERFNGTLSDRLRNARGLQREDAALIKAFMIQYNFVKPHTALKGRTPAEAARIAIRGKNKWRVLIQNAAISP